MDLCRIIMQLMAVLLLLLAEATDASLSQLGSIYVVNPQRFPVDPHAGYRNQRDYVNKHGVGGYRLIEALGNGQYGNGQYTQNYQQLTNTRLNYAPNYYYSYYT